MEKDTINLLSYWASALINGDYSGLEADEAARCRKAESDLQAEGWSIVDVGEPRFTWSYALYDADAGCAGGEVAEYTILRPMVNG